MFHVKQVEVVVIGGGHAGIEAALAAARRGASTILLTHDRRTIGAMSCNPAIGGIGKGHLVREVDALGGIMAIAADKAAIHYRMLNRCRGRAVWGPRVQADRRLFRVAIQRAVSSQSHLTIMEGSAAALGWRGGRIGGVELEDGSYVAASSVVIATGTFLGGRLFLGRSSTAGGRIGEPASALGDQLREISPIARLKTGTPPRIDGRAVDWSSLERQESDGEQWTMAPYRGHRINPQLACAITRTSADTHAIIAAAADQSPLYAGDIAGAGPRYCPSIEDKVRRFADRDGHQIFLEPEALDGSTIYPNGLSTSLPAEIQLQMVRTMPGLAKAEIVEPGYAVEYDHADPRCLDGHLEHRDVTGLFLAGQVNGTTGYEEAAGQGLIAGINAAAHARGLSPFAPDRRESYLGVMIDDLTLQGVTEPYRMLTARAERRLHLRADNAEARLVRSALDLNLLAGCRRADAMARSERRGGLSDRSLGKTVDALLADELIEDRRYAPYVAREEAEHRRAAALDDRWIPSSFDYAAVSGLSIEMRERSMLARPHTLGELRRIRGVTPAAVTAVAAALVRMAA